MVLTDIKEDIDELKSDVRELLEFKWKIYGMTFIVGIVATGVTQMTLYIINKV